MIWVSILLLFQLDPETQRSFNQFFEHSNRFKVNFIQVTESPFLDSSQASGTLSISQPGRLRMVYLQGEEKTIICDGTTYCEDDHLAEIRTCTPLADIKNDPLVRVLLFGHHIETFFLVDRYKSEEGADIYRLRPREKSEFHLEISFNEKWQPLTMAIVSTEGERTQFTFSGFEINPKFPKDWFVIPATDY
ncbi:MAG: hypothetical protein CR997_11500 [Acidobacteria bacterium]|nr:MAG: hypothetical protein CR997_11500 [Acidobacteriota bacterium]